MTSKGQQVKREEDLVRVKIRRGGSNVPEDFLLRPTRTTRLNGRTAMVCGRFGRDGTDKQIEVTAVYFKDEEAFSQFFDFTYDWKLKREKCLFEMTQEEIREHARLEAEHRRNLMEETLRHPALEVAPAIFAAS